MFMKRSAWVSIALFSLLCSLWVPGAFGQAVYGSILGTITDPSGAAVNGAKVTVTSQTKNVSTETTTNESGNYTVTHLIPDIYTIRIEAQGFKQIFVNGQHFSGTGYDLDGTDNQDPILGIIIVNPSLDTVEETKITTQNYDAEFGKAVAGIMSAHTRSGTNQFHGSGYFYD